MSLSHKLTKIGLYAFAHNAEETQLRHSLVGGLAVQVHSCSQYQDFRQCLVIG